MTESKSASSAFGVFTVLDMLLFVAASSVSILLIRLQRPQVPTLEDYLLLTATCGPAGLSLFGPWAVRRQFVDSDRDELQPGEWLWVALGGAWLAATPLMLAIGGRGVEFFTGLIAVVAFVPAVVAFVQSLPGVRRRPWTHWAGIVLALLHASPAAVLVAPAFWGFTDLVVNGFLNLYFSLF
jgi:hypothetical protein